MDQMTQVLQALKELREENASLKVAVESKSTTAFQELREDNTNLKLAIDSLIKSQAKIQDENTKMKVSIESLTKSPTGHGPNADVFQQSECIVLEDINITEDWMLSPDEIRDRKEWSRFNGESCVCNEKESMKKVFRDYRAIWPSTFFKKRWGTYKLPLTGRYQFHVKGEFCGAGETEWFICCDRENPKARNILVRDFDGSPDSPSEEEDQRKVYRGEKRVSLFKLSKDVGKMQEGYILLNAKGGLYVWLEVSQIGNDPDNCDYMNCTFSGWIMD